MITPPHHHTAIPPHYYNTTPPHYYTTIPPHHRTITPPQHRRYGSFDPIVRWAAPPIGVRRELCHPCHNCVRHTKPCGCNERHTIGADPVHQPVRPLHISTTT